MTDDRDGQPSAPNPGVLAKRPPGYAEWLTDLKSRIHAAQQRAALAVNRELVQLYWQLGRDILDRQAQAGWGAGIVDQVASRLASGLPRDERLLALKSPAYAGVCGGLA